MHRFTVRHTIDLLGSLRPLVFSAQDPTIRLRTDLVVRASRTADGPATLVVRRVGDRRFEAEAHGPGADRVLAGAARLLGGDDDLTGFVPDLHPRVARAAHRSPGLRLVATGHVADVLVPTILAQRVTSREAGRSWTLLVRRWGEPAPGPYDLRLPPHPARLAATPYWAFHALGVERSRAERIAAACRRVGLLQDALALPPGRARERLTSVPGVGVWTAAHLLRLCAGDADAVEVGDYWVKDHVAWNLAGEARATDARMLELLEPFAGHRGRVVRLLGVAGQRPPRFGVKPRVVPVDRL